MSLAWRSRRGKQEPFRLAMEAIAMHTTINATYHGRRSSRFRTLNRKPAPSAKRRPRVGLALSGGGVKAVAHIGVLSALVRAGIHFDMVAGTSGGALVGLFHCAGHHPDSMSRLLRAELSGRWWWRCLPFGKYWRLARLLRGGLQSIMRRHVRMRRFEDLPIPFFATSTDLVRGERVVHDQGDVVRAVQASMSIPGLARPVHDGERLLVDGGVLTYLPSEVLKERGADIVIGVELSGNDDWGKDTEALIEPDTAESDTQAAGSLHRVYSVFQRARDLQERAQHGRQLAAADVLIRPQLAGLGYADFAHTKEMFEKGRHAGELAVGRIRALLQKRG